MKIILLFVVSLAIFLPLSALGYSPSKVVDADGKPLNASSRYFILPTPYNKDVGGVRLADLGKEPSTCPTSVVLSKSPTDKGIGVYFTPRDDESQDIVQNSPLNIKFYLDYPNPCNDLLVWKVDNLAKDELLYIHTISTGGESGNPNDVSSWFQIRLFDVGEGHYYYSLAFCLSKQCYDIGIVKQGGYNRLVVTENPMPFQFKLHAPFGGKAEAY